MIGDLIGEWIKGILIDGIMGNLSGLFNTVNTKVEEIASDVGSIPQDWNGGIFSMLQNLSETVIVPIAAAILALVMCYELIDMIVEKNNMHDFDSSMFFRWIFKSAFAILIVTNTWNIVMGVFDATQQVVNQSAGVIIGDTSIDFDTLLPDLESRLEAMDMAVAFYRMLKGIGRRGNWAAFVIGAFGVCLLRTNGWFAMLAALAALALILRRDGKTLLIVLTAVLAVSWVLINPVLWLLKVPSTDLTEAFAVPMQQIARVVSNERELKPEEEALLSEIFDLEKMKELYNPQTVDPVKFETFRYGRKDFFRSHRWEYLKLYLSLGARYPVDYWEAWVEETRGYWNGGYFFWIYPARPWESPVMGIIHTGGDNLIASCYAAWFRAAEKPTAMQPLYSIGLRVWILVACCLINALKKNRQWLIAVPVLVLLVGLWLGTPVYSEFRYAYPMVLTSPFILMTTLYSPEVKTSG